MLSFIDISGDLRSGTIQEKYIAASSVSVRQRKIGDLTRTMHNLKKNILNNETLEIKSTSFINRDTLNDPTKNKHIFIQQVFEQCIDASDCYYSSIVIRNEDVPKNFPKERLSKHYIYLLQRIEKIAVNNHCSNVLVILDNDNRRVDKWIAYAFNNFLYRTQNGRDLGRILEVPIFADSEMTVGIQLADIVAGVLKRYYTAEGLNVSIPSSKESLFHQKLREYHDIILERTPNLHGLFGLYEAPPNFLSTFYT